MEDSDESSSGRFSKRRTLIALMVAVFVVLNSVAVISLSGLGQPTKEKNKLLVLSVTWSAENAYQNHPIDWTIVVSVPDNGKESYGLTFDWDWGDGTASSGHFKSPIPGTTAYDNQTHSWADPGVYDVVILVYDGFPSERNRFHSVSTKLWIEIFPWFTNEPPVAVAQVNPQSGTVDTTFEFDAGASYDSDDPPEALQVRWDWESDGVWDTSYSPDKAIVHKFQAPGAYSVMLEVVDSGGLTDYAVLSVQVDPLPSLKPHAPILIVGDAAFTVNNGVVSGSGTASDPFVIAGWDINASSAVGIEIRDTTAYYILRDLSIHSGASVQPYLHYGMVIDTAPHGLIEKVVTCDNSLDLIIRDSSDIVIANNTFVNDFSGVLEILTSDRIELYDNDIVSSWIGIGLDYCSYITAKGNHFSGRGFSFYGSAESHFNSHMITPDNTVAGRPVLYVANEHDIHIEGAVASQVIVASSTRVSISNLALANVMQGVVLGYVTDSTITGCNFASGFYDCVKLCYCQNVTLTENLVFGGLYYALEAISCQYLTIRNNTVAGCSYGIVLRYYSEGTVVAFNTAYDNYAAILLYQTRGHVEVRENDLHSNDIGILMAGVVGCWVVGNVITTNAHQGVCMESGCSSNTFHHNYFISNAVQVSGDTLNSNTWDDGYPSGGNYWSDYVGVDQYSGPNQDVPGPDGIGDVPYYLASGSADRYPLMETI